MEDYFNSEFNERLCKSASETLDKYIHKYEMKRSKEMARSFKCTQTSDRLLQSLSNDVSALDEEIMLAKNMFADESFSLSDHDRSLTTEELLMEHSFNQSFNISASEHFPVRGANDCRMQYSELSAEPKNYQRHPNQKHVRSMSSLSTIDTNHSNLQCLQHFLHHGRRCGTFASVGNVPSGKYNRSQISSEDIKGELTVSMNYLPQKRLQMTKHNDSNDYSQESYKEHVDKQKPLNNADEEGLVTVSLQLEGKPASVKEFMGECFSTKSVENDTSNAGQRTVESLKNMLFSLQEISTQSKNEIEAADQCQVERHQEDAPGCESLEKAMKHLVILKNLVKEVGKTEKRSSNF